MRTKVLWHMCEGEFQTRGRTNFKMNTSLHTKAPLMHALLPWTFRPRRAVCVNTNNGIFFFPHADFGPLALSPSKPEWHTEAGTGYQGRVIFLVSTALISRNTNAQQDTELARKKTGIYSRDLQIISPTLPFVPPRNSSRRCCAHPSVGGMRGNAEEKTDVVFLDGEIEQNIPFWSRLLIYMVLEELQANCDQQEASRERWAENLKDVMLPWIKLIQCELPERFLPPLAASNEGRMWWRNKQNVRNKDDGIVRTWQLLLSCIFRGADLNGKKKFYLILYLFICRCIKQNITTLNKQNYYLLLPTCLPKSRGVKERRENMDYGL